MVKCQTIFITISAYSFTHCILYFLGFLCNIDKNECKAKPCLNEGICVDKVNDYECTCPVGITGMGLSCTKLVVVVSDIYCHLCSHVVDINHIIVKLHIKYLNLNETMFL